MRFLGHEDHNGPLLLCRDAHMRCGRESFFNSASADLGSLPPVKAVRIKK